MEKKNKKKKNFIGKNKTTIIVIAIALLLLIGGSYAWLTLTLEGTKTARLEAGELALTLDDQASEGINLIDTVPMSDTEGLKTTAYTFTLENTGNITSEYTIYLDDEAINEADTRMSDSVVKYSLTKNSGEATTQLVSNIVNDEGQRVLETGTIDAGNTNTYTLKLWISDTATNSDVQVTQDNGSVLGKVFSSVLRIDASQIKE